MNNEGYIPKLYAACKYMKDNKEDFKDFLIYDSLNDTDAINIHNRLLDLFNFLIGDKRNSNKNSAKGSEITLSIDISNIENKDLAEILAVYHNCLDQCYIKRNVTQSKITVNIEKSTDIWDYLISQISPDVISLENFLNSRKKNQKSKAIILYQESRQHIQLIVNEWIKNTNPTAKDCYEQRIKILTDLLVDECDFWKPKMQLLKFGKLKPFYHTWLYIDLCCWAILQFVITGIMRNGINTCKIESIMKLNNTILSLINKEKIIVPIKFGNKDTSMEMLFKFYSYYHIRDIFLQDTEVLKLITNNGKKRKNPEDKYILPFVSAEKYITWNTLQELFNENEYTENMKTFKKNILNCYEGITYFNRESGRKINFYEPISLKAFYREIYNDKTIYNRKQSKTIFNHFLKYNEITDADYYFIDEKINMGIFREYGLIDEFYAKNELQENLYYLVCLILTKLNPFDIIKHFKDALESITAAIYEIYTEYPATLSSNVNESKECKDLRIKLKEYTTNEKEPTYDYILESINLCFKLYNLKVKCGKF